LGEYTQLTHGDNLPLLVGSLVGLTYGSAVGRIAEMTDEASIAVAGPVAAALAPVETEAQRRRRVARAGGRGGAGKPGRRWAGVLGGRASGRARRRRARERMDALRLELLTGGEAGRILGEYETDPYGGY